MRKLLLAAVATSALATSFVAPVAQAGPPVDGPDGRLCGYFATSDPNPEAPPESMVGVTYGGTLTWDRPFTLHCYLRVNVNRHCNTTLHPPNVPDTCSPNLAFDAHTSSTELDSSDTHEATLEPTQVNYTSGEFDQDYLCTAVSWSEGGGGSLYWHPTDPGPTPLPTDDVPGHWSTDFSKPCSAATQLSTGPIVRLIDELTCPVIAMLHGTPVDGLAGLIWVDNEGDIFIDFNGDGRPTADEMIWDCPVYMPEDALDGDGAYDGDNDPSTL